ncbi:MAG: sugar transferase [Bacteroidales bacterium]|nr:sugar transferase [Bacteroidales bacterium]
MQSFINTRKGNWFQRIFDILIIVFSYLFTYAVLNFVFADYFIFTKEYVLLLLILLPIWALVIKATNLSQIPRVRTYMSIFFALLNISLIGLIAVFLIKYLVRLDTVSHYFIILFGVVNQVLLFSYRILLFRVYKTFRIKGHDLHNLIIIADDDSIPIIESIIRHKEWGYRITMIFSDSDLVWKKYAGKIKVFPERANIQSILEFDVVDELLYCKKIFEIEKIGKLNHACKELGVVFRVRSKVSAVHFRSAELIHVNNEPFLTFMNTPNYSMGWIWKSISDYIIALSLIFFLSPLFLLVISIIKITSPGPAIFKQKRVGLRGRQFYIYKFRTMVQNAEQLKSTLVNQNESDGPAFKIKRDPRITTIGRFLRATSIDELPQLFNVIRGEMSLIGPRPPLPEEVEQYERWQLKRLSVKPGITCTWQIIPNRNDVVFDKWMKLDIQYIENWSYRSDISLIFKTIRSVFTSKGY